MSTSLEAPVGGVGRPGQQRHVGSRGIDDGLEGVVARSLPAKSDAAVVQVEGVPGEAGGLVAGVGDEAAAGEDGDPGDGAVIGIDRGELRRRSPSSSPRR